MKFAEIPGSCVSNPGLQCPNMLLAWFPHCMWKDTTHWWHWGRGRAFWRLYLVSAYWCGESRWSCEYRFRGPNIQKFYVINFSGSINLWGYKSSCLNSRDWKIMPIYSESYSPFQQLKYICCLYSSLACSNRVLRKTELRKVWTQWGRGLEGKCLFTPGSCLPVWTVLEIGDTPLPRLQGPTLAWSSKSPTLWWGPGFLHFHPWPWLPDCTLTLALLALI